MLEIYVGRKAPSPIPTVDLTKLEDLAREKMKDQIGAYMYTFGSAGTSSTDRANRKAFEKWRLIPRMLQDTTVRTIETTIFGVKHSSPLILAPIGVQGMVHPDGELATARAARALGVPFVLSTAATRTIEAAAEANGPNAHRWYQIYWPKSDHVALSLLSRAKASGYSALVVTLDTMVLGWRPHDLDAAFIPFMHGVGCAIGLSDPKFMQAHNQEPIPDLRALGVDAYPYDPAGLEARYAAGDAGVRRVVDLGRAWLQEANSGTFRSWTDLKLLRDNWEGTLILKGITSVADAEAAVDAGADGIVVSNHGGRQVDGAIPALHALAKICRSPKVQAAKRDRGFTVLFDSGIRTGSDMIKAIALGAQGILLGRPYMYGLMLAGQEGIEQVVRSILADMEITLGLIGRKNIEEIYDNRDDVLEYMDSY